MVVKGVNFRSAAFAGLIAGYMMCFVDFWFKGVFGLFGGPMGSFVGTGELAGMTIPHFIDSLFFAVIYAAVFYHVIKGPRWVKGAAFGVILWLFVGILATVAGALGGEVFKMMPMGGKALATALSLHLVYGLILGAFYTAE